MSELYIDLLCRYNFTGVVEFLKTNENYRVDETLKVMPLNSNSILLRNPLTDIVVKTGCHMLLFVMDAFGTSSIVSILLFRDCFDRPVTCWNCIFCPR